MARNRQSRGGRRGRNRGIVTVRQAPYALPVQEPCNFIELSLRKQTTITPDGSGRIAYPITWGDIFNSAGSFTGGSKVRVTSMVIEPATTYAALNATASTPSASMSTPDFTGVLSGNHYESGDTQKPLRIKFSKQQGSDGEWKKALVSPSYSGSMDGYGRPITAETVFGTLDFNDGSLVTGAQINVSFDVRIRIAYTD